MFEISNGNQIIKQIKLNQIYHDIDPISFQRDIDSNRVEDIKNYLIKQKSKNGSYTYEGLITFGILNNKKYCIDGQHRLSAYHSLIDKNSDIDILVDLRTVQSYEELRDLFKSINKSVSVPDYLLYEENNNARKIIKDGINNLKLNYYKFFVQKSNSKRKAKRPTVRQDELENELYHSDYKFKSSEELTEYFEKINYKLSTLTNVQFFHILVKFHEIGYTDKQHKIDDYLDKIYYKDTENPLFIGMFKNFSYLKSKVDFESYLDSIQ
jgi:hypothetical protein